jgi:hypothetical protein
MEHQEDHRPIPFEVQRLQQLVDLVVIQWTRNPLDRFDVNRSPDRPLSGSCAQKRAMPFRDASESGVVHFLDGILPCGELIGEDQVFVKGRDGGEDPIQRCRRETGARRALWRLCGEHQAQPLCPLLARKGAQILQKHQGIGWGKVLHRELVSLQKPHEVQQIEGVSRKGVGRTPSGTQMMEKARDSRNGLILIVQKLKGNIRLRALLKTLDSHRSLAPSI